MNTTRIKSVPLLLALALGACASNTRPSMSYVAPTVTGSEARILAADATAFLADQVPPGRATFVLDPPKAGPDLLTGELSANLRGRGYGVLVANPKTGPVSGQGVPLRYTATPLDSGLVLRLQYLNHDAAKYYSRTAPGQVAADAAPFVVREGVSHGN